MEQKLGHISRGITGFVGKETVQIAAVCTTTCVIDPHSMHDDG
jgi:hypothetical protein